MSKKYNEHATYALHSLAIPKNVDDVGTGLIQAIRWLLWQGADPNAVPHRRPLLRKICNSGSAELLRIFLEWGGDVDKQLYGNETYESYLSLCSTAQLPLLLAHKDRPEVHSEVCAASLVAGITYRAVDPDDAEELIKICLPRIQDAHINNVCSAEFSSSQSTIFTALLKYDFELYAADMVHRGCDVGLRVEEMKVKQKRDQLLINMMLPDETLKYLAVKQISAEGREAVCAQLKRQTRRKR